MAWIVFYYLVLKPLNLLPVDPKVTEKYDDADLIPRFLLGKSKLLRTLQ
jgi:hypothetical protein